MYIELEINEYSRSREFGIPCDTILVTPEPDDKEIYRSDNPFYDWSVKAFIDAMLDAVDFEPLTEWDDNEGNSWAWGALNVYGNSYCSLMFAYYDNGDMVEIELCPEHIEKIKSGKPFTIRGSISI